MSSRIAPSVVVIATEEALPRNRVWGTGGWMPPGEREALDWVTLVRFLGWEVETVTVDTSGRLAIPLAPEAHTVIIASEPDNLSEDTIESIRFRLEQRPTLVVARAGASRARWSTFSGTHRTASTRRGRTITWLDPEHSLQVSAAESLSGYELVSSDATPWATLDDAPLVVARRYGRGIIATLAVHPSEARDLDPVGTALMKSLLTLGAPGPVAWLDFDDTMVLRMDDPGGAQNVYSRTWNYAKLTRDAWMAIGRDLSTRGARISLAYVSGWVDDGDERRGHLTVDGRQVERHPGTVYPSPLVVYEDLAGHSPGTVNDYRGEFEGIQILRKSGLADVELHGFTHMHPDLQSWLRAPDRFESWPDTAWYREFGKAAVSTLEQLPAADQPLVRARASFRDYFGIVPTTLICPGDQWTDATLERALDLGIQLVGSYYLAIRHQDRFCWTQHVCAPYLNRPEAAWLSSGLPIVGYFHDYEPAREGVSWITTWLDRWREAGARRFIDFRELASAIGLRLTIEQDAAQLKLIVHRADAPAAVRSIPVKVRTEGPPAKRLEVVINGQIEVVAIEAGSDGVGLVWLPVSFVGTCDDLTRQAPS
jgi:hypothetical protein